MFVSQLGEKAHGHACAVEVAVKVKEVDFELVAVVTFYRGV